MPRDGSASSMQVLRPGLTHRVVLTAGPDITPALDGATRVVRISGNADVHYTANETADNTKTFLNAGAYEYLSVLSGDRPQFLAPGATGFIVVTEME